MIYLLLKALIIGFSIAMPVGPIGMLCIKNTLTRGFQIGLAVGLGAAFADSFYGFLAGGGLAFISQFLLEYSYFVKLIGGLILLYLGISEIRSANKGKIKEIHIKRSGIFKTIAITFLLTITNPATILAFIGIFSAIGGGNLGLSEILLMILGVFFGSMLWWLILVSCVAIIRHKISEKAMFGIRIFSGLILICFGLGALFIKIS